MRSGFWALAAAALIAVPAAADRGSYDAQYGLIPVGGFVVLFNSNGPLSFQTATPSDVPPGAQDAGEVFGSSCQHGLSVPTALQARSTNISAALGNGGFARALSAIQKRRPEVRGIYDVKVDMRRTSVLGVYRRLCTEVTARGFR